MSDVYSTRIFSLKYQVGRMRQKLVPIGISGDLRNYFLGKCWQLAAGTLQKFQMNCWQISSGQTESGSDVISFNAAISAAKGAECIRGKQGQKCAVARSRVSQNLLFHSWYYP